MAWLWTGTNRGNGDDHSLFGAGTFHHLHNPWIGDLCKAINGGVLPADDYAMGEHAAQDIGPDVLSLQIPVLSGQG